MKRLLVCCVVLGAIALAGCAATTQAVDTPPTSAGVATSAEVVGTPSSTDYDNGLAEQICPNQAAEFDQAVADLVRLNQSDQSSQNTGTLQQNVQLFIDNIQQECGTTFSASQKQQLTKELAQLLQ